MQIQHNNNSLETGEKRTEREKTKYCRKKYFSQKDMHTSTEYTKFSTMDIMFNTDYHSGYYFKDQHTSKSF